MKQFSIILAIIISSFWSFGQKDSVTFYGQTIDGYGKNLQKNVVCKLIQKSNPEIQIFHSDSIGYFSFIAFVELNNPTALIFSCETKAVSFDSCCPNQVYSDLYLNSDDRLIIKERLKNDSILITPELISVHGDPNFKPLIYMKDSLLPESYTETSLNEAMCVSARAINSNKLEIEVSVNTIWNESDAILKKRSEIILKKLEYYGVNLIHVTVKYRSSETNKNIKENNIEFKALSTY